MAHMTYLYTFYCETTKSFTETETAIWKESERQEEVRVETEDSLVYSNELCWTYYSNPWKSEVHRR